MLDTLGDKPLAEVPLVVLDTETTGLSPAAGHRVVEIAALRLSHWQPVAQFSQLVQPDRPIDPGAAAVHGLTDADLHGQPRFGEIAASLLALLDGAVLVAHNAAFDAGFIAMELSRSGWVAPTGGAPLLPNPWLCTMRLARGQFYFGRNNLTHVAAQLGVRVSGSHRAANDVRTTAEVLRRMVRQLETRGLRTVRDLFAAQGNPIYTPGPAALHTQLPPPLQRALQERLDLEIVYAGSGVDESRRVITPLQTREFGGVVYLVAYCHLRQAQRTFRLDRIRNAVCLG